MVTSVIFITVLTPAATWPFLHQLFIISVNHMLPIYTTTGS